MAVQEVMEVMVETEDVAARFKTELNLKKRFLNLNNISLIGTILFF